MFRNVQFRRHFTRTLAPKHGARPKKRLSGKNGERIAAEEKARRDGLPAEAENWRSAKLIREYVEAKRASVAAQASEFEDWSRWALQVADRMDPLFSAKSRSDIEGV